MDAMFITRTPKHAGAEQREGYDVIAWHCSNTIVNSAIGTSSACRLEWHFDDSLIIFKFVKLELDLII